MRIALLYPPPWKIPAAGEPRLLSKDGGPPADFQEGDLDADFFQTPYGLLSLGAQALRAGHQVKVFNLSAFSWRAVEQAVAELEADVFALSCWTANRRGVGLTVKEIRRRHPRAHIIVGGPHATPLPREVMRHYPEIDTLCEGESEASFMELLQRLERGASTKGVAGTWYREGSDIVQGASRDSIRNLDELASPHAYFDTHIFMTSRGCPWACTFCGAESSWGRGFRANSVPYVLDALEQATARARVKMLQIKDDTFTTNKKRVLELCRGIRDRKLKFLWSCDTRVDVLNEELLYEMRLAGCQRLSLGVETGSPTILKNIDKKITIDEIVAAAEMAKKFGVHVRFYMMLGNRGETAQTFRETLEFLARAKPHQYIFSCLSVFPGTHDFQDAERAGWLDRERYFTEDFQELKVPFDASDDTTALLNSWFAQNKGLQEGYAPTTDDCRAILGRLGDHAPAHLDVAGAYYQDGELELAAHHAHQALAHGHPTPGLAYNYLACIAHLRGDVSAMQQHFMTAAKTDPQHQVLITNVQRARGWFAERGPERGLPLELVGKHDFRLLERTEQPALPGALPEGFAEWDTEAPRALPLSADEGTGSVVDRQRQPIEFRSRRLPVAR
ncbi:MAG: B12-binding domain-containing radical SAM protein [Myxococcales bacterium]|nr:MAG: B12-binding domain-containing radical SAM protein [Myxococcales bacterium]